MASPFDLINQQNANAYAKMTTEQQAKMAKQKKDAEDARRKAMGYGTATKSSPMSGLWSGFGLEGKK
jgi:hypothetical protein